MNGMFRQFVRLCSTQKTAMVRVLNVAEKNDAAKSLSDLMSGGRYRKREGFSRFNKIYEFEYNILNQQNVTMSMTSVSGHLLGLEFTGQYSKWHGCSPVTLFDAPVQKYCPQDYNDIKRTLEREIRGCQTLIIWTDCDREGENIGYEIIDVCKAVKPAIRVLRARFSEITPAAIQRACANLIAPDKNVNDAVDVRQELDLRIGAAFTRFQTLRLQKVFPDVLAEQLISYGSCQFPTLGFVVERYKQVQAFIAEPFWKISVHHETEDGTVEFTWKRVRLFDHLACLALYNHVLEEPEAIVTDVRSKPKSKWRPVALDTVELEKLASRKLKINAKETMKIAEKLYTQGYISYPRTETNIFPKELDLRPLVQAQTQDQRWGEFAGGVLERGPTPRNGNKSDKAHPPIHPLKYANNLQGNEARVYEFVVRHFLACCSQDAQGQETTVEIGINEEQFSASGLMIIARNYLDVYPYDRWSAKVIPQFERGERFQPKSIEMNQGETSPPSLLTESDLIALMDKHGIGTDATHADHIETIKSRLYVGVRNDGKFIPGELGMGLVEGYDSMGYEMSKPNLRAELESDLKLICDGQKIAQDVLAQQIQAYKLVFIEATRQAEKIDQALSEYFGQAQQYTAPVMEATVSARKCPKCGNDMVLKTRKDGKSYFLTCMGYPNCRNAIWFPESVLQASIEENTCDKCNDAPRLIKFKFKKGSVPPYIPLEYVSCVGGCDNDLKEILNLRMPPPGPTANSQRPQNNSRDSGLGGSFNSSFGSQSSQSGPRGGRPSQGQGSGRGRGNTKGRGGGTQDSGFGSRSFSTQSSARAPLTSFATNNGSDWRPDPPGGGGGGVRIRPQTAAAKPKPPPSSDSDKNAVVCSCGDDVRELTVRKEGPNTGRRFYVCSKPQDSKCAFFLWADEASDDGGGDGRLVPRGGSQSSWYGGGGGFDSPNQAAHQRSSYGGSGDVKCNCGQKAKEITVQKEGPNKGRPFYGCPKPFGQGCKFFQWGDEDSGGSNTGGGGRGGAGVFPSSQSSNQNRFNSDHQFGNPENASQCNCGEPAKSLTVQKDGPNKGRPFFTCAKPRGQGCNFFQWGDDESREGGSGGGGHGGGEGYGGFSGTGRGKKAATSGSAGGPKRKMTCSNCGQQGHRKNKCPLSTD